MRYKIIMNVISIISISVWFVLLPFRVSAYDNNISGLSIGGVYYLSYEIYDDNNNTNNTVSSFKVKRGYINIKKQLTPWLSARITPDAYHDAKGDMKLRLKYLYAKFKLPCTGWLFNPNVEFGLVHRPWLNFEEHINRYRMQGKMFLEKNGLFNSADFGLTFTSLLGGELNKEYQHRVNKKYPGKYGSVAIGIYNGGGYHAKEQNNNKTIETRITIRMLPKYIPGLQFSYLYIYGKGNKPYEPIWQLNNIMISYEHEYVVLTAQYLFNSKGNQAGDNIYSDIEGYSVFGEAKLMGKKISIITRYDYFDPDVNIVDNEKTRFITGIAYYFYKHNPILVDYDNADKRLQMTVQIKF